MTGTLIVVAIVVVLAAAVAGVYFSKVIRAYLLSKRDKARVFSATELRHYADDIDVKK